MLVKRKGNNETTYDYPSKFRGTHHFLSEKVKPLKSAHRLCTGLNVLEDNVGLSAHLIRLHGHDVEDGAVGGEEGVE